MVASAHVRDEKDNINGVDVASLGETLDAVAKVPELGLFQFRNSNDWQGGSINRSTFKSFYGGGQEDDTRTESFEVYADEPVSIFGENTSPTPVEFLLHALAACMTTTLVFNASLQGIVLNELSSTMEGDIDIRGFTGISEDTPKGLSEIRVNFRAKTDGESEELKALAEMSPVYHSLKGSVPIKVGFETV